MAVDSYALYCPAYALKLAVCLLPGAAQSCAPICHTSRTAMMVALTLAEWCHVMLCGCLCGPQWACLFPRGKQASRTQTYLSYALQLMALSLQMYTLPASPSSAQQHPICGWTQMLSAKPYLTFSCHQIPLYQMAGRGGQHQQLS